jgi:hypothetical protein
MSCAGLSGHEHPSLNRHRRRPDLPNCHPRALPAHNTRPRSRQQLPWGRHASPSRMPPRATKGAAPFRPRRRRRSARALAGTGSGLVSISRPASPLKGWIRKFSSAISDVRGPKVCRLPAGAKEIRTHGPTPERQRSEVRRGRLRSHQNLRPAAPDRGARHGGRLLWRSLPA